VNRARALAQLSVCLRGQIPVKADWPEILHLANESLITTELFPLLTKDEGVWRELPEDVLAFLQEVHRRNRARNASLFETLRIVIAGLNAVDIEPVLLKGCGMWASCPTGEPSGDRMVSDLDLLVKPSEGRKAVDALVRAGFSVLEDHEADEDHAVAILGRTQDAGGIDLHRRAPAPVGIPVIDDLYAHCRAIDVGGLRARLPRPELQILILSLHDQIHGGNFWMGGFSLRHLIDVAKLMGSAEPIDWSFLMSACPTRFVRDVVETEILASQHIAAAKAPHGLRFHTWAKAHYFRLRLQYIFPALNIPLRWLGRIVRWRHLPVRARIVRDARAG
jgi:putative nucleotidyltransferase-like protein